MAPKKGSKRTVIERPPLDFKSLTVAKATPQTMKEHRPVGRVRDDEQLQIDGIVKAAYQEWVAAGKPSDWTEQPGTYLSVPESQLDTLKWRVTRAGTHYDLKIKFSSPEISKVELTDEDGEGTGEFMMVAEVVFTATDKPSGESSEEQNES